MNRNSLGLALLLTLAFLNGAFAAPSLRVTKLPVGPHPSYTGPTNDPHAVKGQWFRSLTTSNTTYRSCEFYDNTANNGGGYMGHLSISGRVFNVNQFPPNVGPILGFEIDATIINDTPGTGTWMPGTNTHDEVLFTANQQTGTLRQVMLTADFAISSLDNLPSSFDPPYRRNQTLPLILAVNHDHEAWYCWNQDQPQYLQQGNYYVPTWSLGDIPTGTSVTIRLTFSIPVGLNPSDPRGQAILDSRDNGTDILANRTLSLKIGSWLNDFGTDDGSAYPENSLGSGFVSVFHNLDSIQEETPATNHCFKWSQPPDCVNGVDVASWGVGTNEAQWLSVVKVADDWLCDGRPVSGIRWWGSYKDWATDTSDPAVTPPFPPIHPNAFLVTWHADIPASPTNLFSRPGPVIDWSVYPVAFSLQPLPAGIVHEEPWCVSELKFVAPGFYEHEYQYTLQFPPADEWIEKEGSIYWLSIQAVYTDPPATNVWGWKTTDPHYNWNDDAVQITTPPVTNKLTYPPPGWESYPHPYASQSVNMAFELITDVCPRRAKKWTQPPDMVTGVNMPSFWYASGEPSQKLYRADDWLCDGRRVTDIHWWGSYLNYLTNLPGPVNFPTNPAVQPLGFSIAWYSDIPTNQSQSFSQPGTQLASLFVPLTNCHEVYYGTVPQNWPAGTTNYEHEFQYYVDLLNVASPWFETSGVVYWLGIQAVFPPSFIPQQETLHKGWGWKTTPPTNRWNDASTVSNAAGPGWQPATYPQGHPLDPQPCDLAFELTTDEPGTGTNWWNQPIVIRTFGTQTNSVFTATSVGDAGAGVQILQYSTNLLATNWVNIATNALPLPSPYSNYWRNILGTASQRFFRVLQK